MAAVPLFPRNKRQARGKLPLYYFLYFFQDGADYILFKLRSRALLFISTDTNATIIILDFVSFYKFAKHVYFFLKIQVNNPVDVLYSST